MKKTKIIIIILIVLVALVAIYLNRAYAYIYSKFDSIQSPNYSSYMTAKILADQSQILTYVAIGDSLSAGVGASSVAASLPALLAEKISDENGRPVQVKNLGVAGAKSFDLLTGQIIEAGQLKPQIITLFIGTNDLHNFVPLEKFKSNLLAAVKSLKQTTSAEIYLINLPYLGAKDLVLPPYDLYFEWQLKRYNAVIASAAQETGVKLVDLYSASDQPFRVNQNLYCLDRFHPSDAGYALWADIIYAQLK